MSDKRLLGMLARIFSDGVLEDAERAELQEHLRSGALTPESARATMSEFLLTTMKHALADGTVTERERAKLRLIVDTLALPADCIPEDVKKALRTGDAGKGA